MRHVTHYGWSTNPPRTYPPAEIRAYENPLVSLNKALAAIKTLISGGYARRRLGEVSAKSHVSRFQFGNDGPMGLTSTCFIPVMFMHGGHRRSAKPDFAKAVSWRILGICLIPLAGPFELIPGILRMWAPLTVETFSPRDLSLRVAMFSLQENERKLLVYFCGGLFEVSLKSTLPS